MCGANGRVGTRLVVKSEVLDSKRSRIIGRDPPTLPSGFYISILSILNPEDPLSNLYNLIYQSRFMVQLNLPGEDRPIPLVR